MQDELAAAVEVGSLLLHHGPLGIERLSRWLGQKHVIHAIEPGEQFGTGARWQERIWRIGQQHHEGAAAAGEFLEPFGMGSPQRVEVSADEGG